MSFQQQDQQWVSFRKMQGIFEFYFIYFYVNFLILYWNYMDEQPIQPRDNSKISDDLNRISGMSVQQLSEGNRLSHQRPSLIQVLSVEGSDIKQDIYEYYLIQDPKNPSSMRNSNNSSRMGESSNLMDQEDISYKRRSSNNRTNIHECNCNGNHCLSYHCSCYIHPNEMCFLGNCCQGCVQMKNSLLKGKAKPVNIKNEQKQSFSLQGHSQNNNKHNQKQKGGKSKTGEEKKAKQGNNNKQRMIGTKPINKDIFCSCKKSNCLKKYCNCFSYGQQCSQNCQCLNCENLLEEGDNHEEKSMDRQRYSKANQDIDIQEYLQQEDYQNRMMAESMQFDPPDFKMSYQN